ncbi:tryptophan--tRNA ligase [Actinomycetes bacterium KLBMP 9797]
MTATLTGFQPTGHLHVGNLFGAIRPIVAAQRRTRPVVLLVDLHAMTMPHDPGQLRALTLEQATVLLAAGLDPERALLYVQSQVSQHTELHYLLECTAAYGEAHRMIQFKEKSTGRAGVRLSLLTYPVLMAADILLHATAEVPVGDDQRQHLELTRDMATRFNTRYGTTFVVPRMVKPPVAARVLDLSEPTRKMGKSSGNGAGTVFVLDPPEVITRKVMRAVTDSVGTVEPDPDRPGVNNLLELLAACVDESPAALAAGLSSYGELKRAVAEALVATLRPVQARYAELARDPGYVRRVLAEGAEQAREITVDMVDRTKRAIGLLT